LVEGNNVADPIEFFFDFSSPYGYLAANRIENIGQKHGCDVLWKPFLLGAVFKTNGQVPLKEQALKWDYSRRDIERMAKRYKIKWVLPEIFPVATQVAGRAFYWINEKNPELAKKFALLVYQKYFVKGVDITSKDTVAKLVIEFGLDIDECRLSIDSDIYKEKLKLVTAEAIKRNVCGSPFIFIGKEPFWGQDRLDMVDEWLKKNGW
jgi:2-hydroxychromene-2-carboxylate isomerase